jgi:hypothetical protein
VPKTKSTSLFFNATVKEMTEANNTQARLAENPK